MWDLSLFHCSVWMFLRLFQKLKLFMRSNIGGAKIQFATFSVLTRNLRFEMHRLSPKCARTKSRYNI